MATTRSQAHAKNYMRRTQQTFPGAHARVCMRAMEIPLHDVPVPEKIHFSFLDLQVQRRNAGKGALALALVLASLSTSVWRGEPRRSIYKELCSISFGCLLN